MNKFNAVVIGVGLAGKARIRDISSIKPPSFSPVPIELQNVSLVGYVSRRDLEFDDLPQMTMEDVLQDKNINVAIICTENVLHEYLARQCLQAGKHVLVEFPIARDASTAKELFNLAKEKGLLCYEEDISLLTNTHNALKSIIKEKPKLTKGFTYLEGSFNGWIENIAQSGSPFHSSITHIHRLVDCYGKLKAKSARMEVTETSIMAEGVLETEKDEEITISLKRKVTTVRQRKTGFKFEFEDGSVVDSEELSKQVTSSSEPNKPGLFMQDFSVFMNFLYQEEPGLPADREHIIMHSLELADALFEMAKAGMEGAS